MSDLSKRLRELRTKRKLLQSDIAKSIGVETSVYSKYERGINEPDIDTLKRLADFFESTIDYLVGRETKESLKKTVLREHAKVLETELMKLTNYINNSK